MQEQVYGVLRGMAEALPTYELRALSLALTDMHAEACKVGDETAVALTNLLALPMELVMVDRLYGRRLSTHNSPWWKWAWEKVEGGDKG